MHDSVSKQISGRRKYLSTSTPSPTLAHVVRGQLETEQLVPVVLRIDGVVHEGKQLQLRYKARIRQHEPAPRLDPVQGRLVAEPVLVHHVRDDDGGAAADPKVAGCV